MKTFRLIGIALMALVLCLGFASCSDDDDNNKKSSTTGHLEGTAWKVISNTEDEEEYMPHEGWDEGTEDEYDTYDDYFYDSNWTGCIMRFKKNNIAEIVYKKGKGEAHKFTYARYTVDNKDIVRIVLGEGHPDDYIKGTFIINGKHATYTYDWHDYYGAWNREEEDVFNSWGKDPDRDKEYDDYYDDWENDDPEYEAQPSFYTMKLEKI